MAAPQRYPRLLASLVLVLASLLAGGDPVIRTVEDLLQKNKHISADGNGGGCVGTAPNQAQTKWFVLLCEHTASGTTHNILHNKLGIASCAHRHTYASGDADFGIMFLANPFHRVLSNAFFHGVTAGRYRATSARSAEVATRSDTPDTEREIAQFRDFVRGYKFKRIAPQSVVEQLVEARNVSVQFYGYTTSYMQDMTALLRHLGYDSSFDVERVVSSTKAHCLSSCSGTPGKEKRSSSVKTAQQNREKRYDVPWFDAETAAIVVEAFRGDFERYGWSQRPQDMYKPPRKRIRSPCFE